MITKIKRCIKSVIYHASGRTPWVAGYLDRRDDEVLRSIADSNLLERFRGGETLPIGYGIGIDERIVEYPWLISRLGRCDGWILDAGGTLNHPSLLATSPITDYRLLVVTLAPESFLSHSGRVSYLFDDLRSLPIQNESFVAITCLSTLEHVGLDNTLIYTDNQNFNQCQRGDYAKVLTEFHRILEPGGKLFCTMPFGQPTASSWLQQFDATMVQAVIDAFECTSNRVDVFAYSEEGWQRSTIEDSADAIYFDVHASGRRREPDLAAAARAVVCIELTK